jgi:ribonuclease HII
MFLYKNSYLKYTYVTSEENLETSNAINRYNSDHNTSYTIATLAKYIKDRNLLSDALSVPYFTKKPNDFGKSMIRQDSNNVTISIDNKITKVIKDVYFRSVGIEVNADGEPIYETIQFIAKDLEEF